MFSSSLKYDFDSDNNRVYEFSKFSERFIIGKEYYRSFLELLNNYSNDFIEDIEISIFENLKEENSHRKDNLSTIKDMINESIKDEESKKGFLALVKQSYLLGKLRTYLEEEFIVGVFGKKKSGKSTFIKKIFKGCETNSSYENSTIGLNLYKIKNTENFAIMDSPGDTENDKYLEKFSSKGYLFSKMLIYIIDERKQLDADAIRKNDKLKILIRLRLKYKIPFLILLTHSDDCCDALKKSPENKNKWKKISKEQIDKNKINLLEYINKIIKEDNGDYEMDENDIIHTVLIEPNKLDMNEDEKNKIIGNFTPLMKKMYENANENDKLEILKSFTNTIDQRENEVHTFLDEEIKISRPKDLIEIIKTKLPTQYHIALND